MQPRGSGGRDPFFDFGGPFAGFRGSGGFGGHQSLMSNFFGGKDPFNDPFFAGPLGGMFQSNIFGATGSPFGQPFGHPFRQPFGQPFGQPLGQPFGHPFGQPSGFLEHQGAVAQRSTGPIIEELNSDDENEELGKDNEENPRKHGRSSDKPYVEYPEDVVQEKKGKYLQYGDDYNRHNTMQSHNQARSFTFQSSSVTYGGSNGAYYTSSTTKRTGSDGVTIEESKEADTTTQQATHRISRGLHTKGHSMTRKLHSDGKVDSMQTLHNLNEDELAGFEEAWKVNGGNHLAWRRESGNGHHGNNGTHQSQIRQGGWALPSPQQSESTERLLMDNRDGRQWPLMSQGRRDRNRN